MEQLERQTVQRCGEAPGLSLEGAREAVADVFEFPSWEEMREEVERRGVLNRCNLPEARARIARDRGWATTDLEGWCDHCLGAAPLNYMAMLRFDAPRRA